MGQDLILRLILSVQLVLKRLLGQWSEQLQVGDELLTGKMPCSSSCLLAHFICWSSCAGAVKDRKHGALNLGQQCHHTGTLSWPDLATQQDTSVLSHDCFLQPQQAQRQRLVPEHYLGTHHKCLQTLLMCVQE